nr:hypothetical protein [uncultured Chryseobacterium sp.]
MKKYFILLSLAIVIGCSDNGDTADAQSADGKEGSTATFILKNNYMYVVDQMNLNVFSIIEPANPVKVKTVNVGFNIETLFSMDHYLFIGSRSGMYIYSITQNPETPVFVSKALHFTACDPVVANSTHAFVTLHSNTVCNAGINNKLMVYNIANIQNPLLISERDLLEPKGLALSGNYLFICDKNDIVIFNISDPQNVTVAKTIPNIPAKDLIIDGNRMYAFTSSTVHQFNLDPSNIQNITPVSAIPL